MQSQLSTDGTAPPEPTRSAGSTPWSVPGTPREDERLASLRSYRVLDTCPDPAIDALTAAVARALDMPTAALALLDIDRLWFESRVGVDKLIGSADQIALSGSFIRHVLDDPDADVELASGVLVIPDTSVDPRFAAMPAVTGAIHLRAYAGALVVGRDGLLLGVLDILGQEPHRFDQTQLRTLTDLATAAAELLELGRVDATAGLAEHDVLSESRRLRAGIDDGELVVHYPPIVTLPTGAWTGVEALVRWRHPERGLLAPGAFLPVAEVSGLVVPLGARWSRWAFADDRTVQRCSRFF